MRRSLSSKCYSSHGKFTSSWSSCYPRFAIKSKDFGLVTHHFTSRKYTQRCTIARCVHSNCSSPGSRLRHLPRRAAWVAVLQRESRYQHTQAARNYDEDTSLSVFETGTLVLESTTEHGEDQKSSNTIDGATLDKSLLELAEDNRPSQDLLAFVKREAPHAAPTARIYECKKECVDEELEETERDIRVELVNDEYGISCGKTINWSEQDHTSLDLVFENLAQDYLLEVTKYLKIGESGRDGVKTHNTRNLSNALEMEQILPSFYSVNYSHDDASHIFVFQVQMYSGQDPVGRPQIWTSRVTAEQFARASANSDLLRRAEQAGLDLEALRSAPASGSSIPRKKGRSLEMPRAKQQDTPRVYDVSIREDCITATLRTLRHLRQNGLPDEFKLEPFRPLERSPSFPKLDRKTLKSRSKYLKFALFNRKISEEQRALLEIRNKLPIRQSSAASRIQKLVHKNDVLVLVSETGSGKTTQLPQILLENAIKAYRGSSCNIICTQPRRIAATSVAARVALEWNTTLGDTIGYQVRHDYKLPAQDGSINYVTAGVLLNRLQNESEEILEQFSHIVIDEVHERDLNVDLLLTILRDLLRARKAKGQPFPKLILMSATMQSVDFEKYFAEASDQYTPLVASIDIPGRAHPITVHTLDDIVPSFTKYYANDEHMMSLLRSAQEYLQWEDDYASKLENIGELKTQKYSTNDEAQTDSPLHREVDPFRDAVIPYSLITATIIHTLQSDEQGDILVFLPGMKEIDTLADMLESKTPSALGFGNDDRLRMFKLHSALYETNDQVFQPVPQGCRRIILATDIAQTSVTLPNVVHVIDTGKRRTMLYDQLGRKNDFAPTWIDQATSLQRRGRAGRIRSGHYWAMFTDARFQALPEKARPEILTSNLTTCSLVVKSYSNSLDLRDFFARSLDAPAASVVTACIDELRGLGMLTDNEEITPLGKFCADFPLSPAKARGLLLGILFGCFTPMLLAASHDLNSPLIHSGTNRKGMYYTVLEFASTSDDDRCAFVKAFLEYERAFQTKSAEDIDALEGKLVKGEAYRAMLSVSHQLFGVMTNYGLFQGTDLSPSSRSNSVFGLIPDAMDVNQDRFNLFKALALSINSNNLAVWDEDELSFLVKDLKCVIRPYSVNTLQSFRLLERPAYRKSGEVVGFSDMTRNVVASPRPFLTELSSITPLMAMLFGGPIALIDNDTIEIDGWLRYRIRAVTDKNQTSVLDSDADSPARTIVEFRKALDRFLTLAFSDLRDMSCLTAREKEKLKYNFHFTSDHLRKYMQQGLVQILELDADHWDEEILAKRQS